MHSHHFRHLNHGQRFQMGHAQFHKLALPLHDLVGNV